MAGRWVSCLSCTLATVLFLLILIGPITHPVSDVLAAWLDFVLSKASIPGGFLVDDRDKSGFCKEIMNQVYQHWQARTTVNAILRFPQEMVLCHGLESLLFEASAGKFNCCGTIRRLFFLASSTPEISLCLSEALLTGWKAPHCISWNPVVGSLVCHLI